jgi:uncharacterized DUF497 family protein
MKLNFTVKWDESKNEWLKTHRGISFEAVVTAIENGRLLEDTEHPSPRWKHQRILVVELEGYICVVPYVRDNTTVFWKTIYRSREMNQKYRGPS